MDRQQLFRQLSAEQFAMYDTQLYLDTHPHDKVAMNMFCNYTKAYEEYKKQYESHYGPLFAENGVAGDKWAWVKDPWPWEKEAN